MPMLSFEDFHSGGDATAMSCNSMELSFCLANLRFTPQSSSWRRFAHYNCNKPLPPANSTIPCNGSDVAARKQNEFQSWLADHVFVFPSKISTASEQLCPVIQLRRQENRQAFEVNFCDKNKKLTTTRYTHESKPPASNDRPCDGSDAAARPARPTLSQSFDQVLVLPSKMSTFLQIP